MNAIRCNTCGTTIESTHRHDFVWCACPLGSGTEVADAGGSFYKERTYGVNASWEELGDDQQDYAEQLQQEPLVELPSSFSATADAVARFMVGWFREHPAHGAYIPKDTGSFYLDANTRYYFAEALEAAGLLRAEDAEHRPLLDGSEASAPRTSEDDENRAIADRVRSLRGFEGQGIVENFVQSESVHFRTAYDLWLWLRGEGGEQ